MLIYFRGWNLLLFPISVWRVLLAEFVVYVFTNLGIHVSVDNENVVYATSKEG